MDYRALQATAASVAAMVVDNRVDVQFGQRFKDARETKGWSQAETAKRLQQRGLRIYDSTVARIEAGARPVKLTELVAAAALFGVSIDALVQHEVKSRGDQAHVLMVVAGTAVKVSDHLIDGMLTLRDRVHDLSMYDDLPGRDDYITSCERAYGLLVDTNAVLGDLAQAARKGAGRALRRTQ